MDVKNKVSIFELLKSLNVTSEDTREVFAERTRDVSPLLVYKDRVSGVIYIDDFFVGEDIYKHGDYRTKDVEKIAGRPDLERHRDCARRVESNRKFFSGKSILDFGCGAGDFLRSVAEETESVIGVELQANYRNELVKDGIKCLESLSEVASESLDTIFLFHVLEHIQNPLKILYELKSKLKPKGLLVIEVPHGGDILLNHLHNESFKSFTLWSQHLVLHTRYSLKSLLKASGFSNIMVKGCQRFPLSNHLHWLSNGKPGGHKSVLSGLDDEMLRAAYEASLNRIDGTDTLIAIVSLENM